MKRNLLVIPFLFFLFFVQAQTSFRIDFNESTFPAATTTLVTTGSTTVFSANYDIVEPTSTMIDCSETGATEYTIYQEGQDGINDLRVEAEVIRKGGLLWTQTEADYATTSSGSWRSDYSINNGQSRPNDYAYVKFTFTFLGDFANNIPAEFFSMRHTSANGSSEAYEYTLISINNTLTASEEAAIGSYMNTIYNNVSSVPVGSAMPYTNGSTISEFITGTIDTDGSQGGQVRAGLWAIDDFNTIIIEGNEDPTAGNGSVTDDQVLNAATDIGITANENVVSVTYILGLYDVSFDLDADGRTGTNSLPSASIDYFEIGYPDDMAACPLPIELTSFTAIPVNDGVELVWTTASETDNDYFQVERSYDAKAFIPVAKVDGSGTTLTPQTYSYLDATPKSGVVYYRLKQVDITNAASQIPTYEYSDVLALDLRARKKGEVLVYPSLAHDMLTISSTSPIQKIQLFDLSGRPLSVSQLAGSSLSIDYLPSGIYFVKVWTVEGIVVKRFEKV
jgi:hypothetical protein